MDLITGATGFIGGHLVRRLVSGGRPVRVLCRPGSEARLPAGFAGLVDVAHGDLRDRDSLVRAARGTVRVFHCAGEVSDWGSDEAFCTANVRGTRWLVEAARTGGARRLVHLSSIAAFGTPAPAYFDDDSPYGASRDGYSRSKALGEQVAREAGWELGLPVAILRPAVVYGPGGTWLEQPLRMIERGRMFLLAGGRGTCHPCYIANLIDAIVLAADHPAAAGHGFIVADGEAISFRAYFDAVASIAGKPPIRRSIPLGAALPVAWAMEIAARAAGSPRRPLLTRAALGMVTAQSRMSSDKIRSTLGFRPRYTFRSAIDELRTWYAATRSAAASI
ncbi:MAG TPA: NAD-dependent epimerase/dehydratase family protein [Kofleriaceae bacterium]|jgi:nucleoside-diphosphate-sugar epimerase|nr:NAD-dependent epimerase/dehydratase family protein [Kofleriaceae bacterium]